MDLAAPQHLDHRLAKLAQADAGAGQVWIGCQQAEQIALGRIAIPTQQEVGAAEVEKRQGMGLDDLGQIHQPPEFFGRWRDGDGQELVAGFGRCQQMAYRTDAADAGGDSGHLREGPSLAKALKAPKFHHVEPGRCDGSCAIEVDGDLGVPLDAGHRIDRDRAVVGGGCRWGAIRHAIWGVGHRWEPLNQRGSDRAR